MHNTTENIEKLNSELHDFLSEKLSGFYFLFSSINPDNKMEYMIENDPEQKKFTTTKHTPEDIKSINDLNGVMLFYIFSNLNIFNEEQQTERAKKSFKEQIELESTKQESFDDAIKFGNDNFKAALKYM